MDLATFSKRMTLTPVLLDDIQAKPEYKESAQQWYRDFKSQYLPGDLLFHYDSCREDWDRMMGNSGYILVRNGQIVDSLVLMMN